MKATYGFFNTLPLKFIAEKASRPSPETGCIRHGWSARLKLIFFAGNRTRHPANDHGRQLADDRYLVPINHPGIGVDCP